MLGPKITYVTKQGARVSMRMPLLIYLFYPAVIKKMKEMVDDPFPDDSSNDIVTFRSNGTFQINVLRIRKEDMAFLRWSWL